MIRAMLALCAVAGCSAALLSAEPVPPEKEWRTYGHDSGGMRFSPLRQITAANVSNLRVAWTYKTGELDNLPMDPNHRQRITAFESTPLIVDGVLYFSTPQNRVIALDAASGLQKWVWDPQAGREKRRTRQHRGVAYWPGGRRIFTGTMEGKLVALNAADGKPCPDFGDNGIVDLRAGVADAFPDAAYGVTSPPAIFENLVITGAEVPEGSAKGPSGMVRAFDSRTGKLVWTFNTIPLPGEFGSETWAAGSTKDRTGVNVWSMMSVDRERGMVFLPTGSASYDFYGGDRVGANLFANSLIALDARTGRRVWHHQLVHHDLWDYDLPAMPMLVRGGGRDLVVQLNKTGFVFVFDRATGKPVFPIEERAAPASAVEGEVASKTQPWPVKPPPLSRTKIEAGDLNTLDPKIKQFCADMFASAEHQGIFTPWSDRKLTVMMPGTLGGATWSGGSYHPGTGLLYVNVNEFGAIGQLKNQRRTSPYGDYARFGTPELVPCTRPPWGKLVAVDVARGEIAWSVPLGSLKAWEGKVGGKTGAPNIGGSIVTAGGLVFIGSTNDSQFHSFDARTGKEVWTAQLPASAYATPVTYEAAGRQFVAIAAGGGGFFSREGADVLVAYALPDSK